LGNRVKKHVEHPKVILRVDPVGDKNFHQFAMDVADRDRVEGILLVLPFPLV
jgi:hypothetical protein